MLGLQSRVSVIGLLLSACVTWAFLLTPVFAQEPVANNPHKATISESAKSHLELLKAAHKDLQSGVFKADGEKVNTHTDGRTFKQPSEMKCHFDYRLGCWRYENRETMKMSVTSVTALPADLQQQLKNRTYQPKARPRLSVAMYARTPDYSVEWNSYGERGETDCASMDVTMRRPDARPDVHVLHPFCPNACGLLDWNGFVMGWDIPEILKRYAEEAESIDTEVDKEGNVRVIYTMGMIWRVIVMDPELGYSVVSMSQYTVDESGKRVTGVDPSSIESSAEWKMQNDVWVPVRFSVSRYVGRGFTNRYSFDLKWESVNPEKIDPKMFTYQSFEGVWDGKDVYDRRSAKSVKIDTIRK